MSLINLENLVLYCKPTYKSVKTAKHFIAIVEKVIAIWRGIHIHYTEVKSVPKNFAF